MTTFLESSAPALPKIFGTSGDVPSSITENFLGASGDAPFRIFRRMNSALRKICQIPCLLSRVPCPSLAKASGMGRKIVKGLHLALSTPHYLCALMHACTPARLHAFGTQWRKAQNFLNFSFAALQMGHRSGGSPSTV
jgi:hypothetical protein